MEPEATLKDRVQQHRVTWEIGPSQELVEHRPPAVGFELRLFGRHGSHVQPSPGCPECVSLHDRLRAIAEATFPKEHRPTRYEIEPLEAAFRLRPESQWKPEVQLKVRIVHRDDYLRPLDECEKRCAEEIQKGGGKDSRGSRAVRRVPPHARRRDAGEVIPSDEPSRRERKGR